MKKDFWLILPYNLKISLILILIFVSYKQFTINNIFEDNINWHIFNYLLLNCNKFFSLHSDRRIWLDIINYIHKSDNDPKEALLKIYIKLLNENIVMVEDNNERKIESLLCNYIKEQIYNINIFNEKQVLKNYRPIFFYQVFISAFLNLLFSNKDIDILNLDIKKWLKIHSNIKSMDVVIKDSFKKDLIYQYVYCNYYDKEPKLDNFNNIVTNYTNINNIDLNYIQLFDSNFYKLLQVSYKYYIKHKSSNEQFKFTTIPFNLKNTIPIYNIDRIHIIRDKISHKSSLVWKRSNLKHLPKLIIDKNMCNINISYYLNNNFINIKRYSDNNDNLFNRTIELKTKKVNTDFLYELNRSLVNNWNNKKLINNIHVSQKDMYFLNKYLHTITKDEKFISNVWSSIKNVLNIYDWCNEVYKNSVFNKSSNNDNYNNNYLDIIYNNDYAWLVLYQNIVFSHIFKDDTYIIPSFLCSRTSRLYESGFSSCSSLPYTRLLHVSNFHKKHKITFIKNIQSKINNEILNKDNELYNEYPLGSTYKKYLSNINNNKNIIIPYSWDMSESNLSILNVITLDENKIDTNNKIYYLIKK